MNQATFLSQTLWYFSEASAFTDVLLVCKDGQVAISHHQKHHHYRYHQSLCTVGLQGHSVPLSSPPLLFKSIVVDVVDFGSWDLPLSLNLS